MQHRLSSLVAHLLFSVLVAACSASTPPASSHTGDVDDANGVDAGDDDGTDEQASDDDDGSSDDDDDDDASGDDATKDGCNRIEVAFKAQKPNVFVLVDRSSSMFEQGFWKPLRTGVLSVIEQLQNDVRFGFTTYTGKQGGVCPDLAGIDDIATGNYADIAAVYEKLEAPEYTGETPTARALKEVADRLIEAKLDGPEFILLVTDGEPDFCDNPNVTCSRDAVVAEVQRAHAAGIGTFIFSIGGAVNASHLLDVANAGTGQPVQDHADAVKFQCGGGTAEYSTMDGDAPFFEPDVTNQQALAEALGGVVAGVRSCKFELEGKVKILLEQASLGVVRIDGKDMLFNDPDGWRMNSATQLELVGGACSRLKRPDTKSVLIDFPCEAVIVL